MSILRVRPRATFMLAAFFLAPAAHFQVALQVKKAPYDHSDSPAPGLKWLLKQ